MATFEVKHSPGGKVAPYVFAGSATVPDLILALWGHLKPGEQVRLRQKIRAGVVVAVAVPRAAPVHRLPRAALHDGDGPPQPNAPNDYSSAGTPSGQPEG